MITYRFNSECSELNLFVISKTLVQHFIYKYNDQIKFRPN
jgi:hypothetical protein